MTAQPTKLTTARKIHSCQLCDYPIYIGERYVNKSYPPWEQYESGGDFWRLKACRFCFESKFVWNDDYLLNTSYFVEMLLEHWMAEAGWPGQDPYGCPKWWSKTWADWHLAKRDAWAEVKA